MRAITTMLVCATFCMSVAQHQDIKWKVASSWKSDSTYAKLKKDLDIVRKGPQQLYNDRLNSAKIAFEADKSNLLKTYEYLFLSYWGPAKNQRLLAQEPLKTLRVAGDPGNWELAELRFLAEGYFWRGEYRIGVGKKLLAHEPSNDSIKHVLMLVLLHHGDSEYEYVQLGNQYALELYDEYPDRDSLKFNIALSYLQMYKRFKNTVDAKNAIKWAKEYLAVLDDDEKYWILRTKRIIEGAGG